MRILSALLYSTLLLTPLTAAAEEHVPVQQLLDTRQTIAGQEITVPEHPTVKVMRLTIPPGVALPVHKHPYPRYGYVLKGEVEVTLVDQKKTMTFKEGDVFAEIIDGWHFGTNHGASPVELLIIDQVPEGVNNNTMLKSDSPPPAR